MVATPLRVLAAALVALCAVAAVAVRADTPANCMYEQIAGTWTFHKGAGGHTNTLNCSSFAAESEYEVTLKYPDVAVDKDGKTGTWTMIYNQGFEVIVAGAKYFAFSLYETKDGKTVSVCGETLNGWYHNDDGTNWGCYRGVRTTKPERTVSVARPAPSHTQHYRSNPAFVARINRAQSLWTAVDYPEHERYTLAQMTRRAGGMLSAQGPMPPFGGVAALHSRRPAAPRAPLPASFDWRSVNGVDFVSPVRDQEECGSCFAFASAAMLEARLRVASNNSLQVVLSPQDVVSCSEYSQGCDGGFSYLTAGKYAQDFGMLSEKCYPYQGVTTACKPECDEPRYRVSQYGYVGGYYGAASARAMQEEILAHGPVAVGFEVYQDFFKYKGGVYKHTTEVDEFNPFQLTNHAVLCVGWGEENGVPFWIAKNSWGPTWGENGFFRILRNSDECAFESMPMAATPIYDPKTMAW